MMTSTMEEQESAIIDYDQESGLDDSRSASPAPLLNGGPSGMHSSRLLQRPGMQRQDSTLRSWVSWAGGARRPKQKSLGEAIKTVRTRKASVSESAHEIADSLKAPVSLRLVVRSSLLAYLR
jgi:solute carrier family 35 protein E1